MSVIQIRTTATRRKTGYGWVPVNKTSEPAVSGEPALLSSGEPAAAGEGKKPAVNMKLPWLSETTAVGVKKQPAAQRHEISAEGARRKDDVEIRLMMRGRLDAYAKYVKQFANLDSLIELLLTEARDSANADGGTFYTVTPNGFLKFSHFQNDTASSRAYAGQEIPIDTKSICGYVARTASILSIDDVHKLSEDASYSFNSSFDEKTGYRTVSMLTVPMISEDGSVIAVMQLINKLGADGTPIPFSGRDTLYARMLANKIVPFISEAIRREGR